MKTRRKVRPIYIISLILVLGLVTSFYGYDYFGRHKTSVACVVISKDKSNKVTVYVPPQRTIGGINVWDGNYIDTIGEWRWAHLERGEVIYMIMDCGPLTGIPYYYEIQ